MDEKHVFIAFIALAAFVRFALVFVNQGLWWDEAVYVGLAESLRQGTYGLAGAGEADRPPLFPYLLAFVGTDVLVGRLFVWVLTSAAVYVVYVLGRELYGRNVGLAAAAVLSSYQLFVFFTNKLLSEALFVTLFAASLVFLNRALNDVSPKSWLLLGFLTGLTLLTRYPAAVLAVSYAAYILYARRYRGFAYFIGAFVLTLLPWLIHSTLTFGTPWGAYTQNARVFLSLYAEPWYYFFANYFQVFGPVGVLFVVGTLTMVKRRVDFVLLLSLLLFVVFSLPSHKELRYFVSFFPLYALISAWPLTRLKGKEKNGFVFALLVLSSLSLVLGATATVQDSRAATSLVQAAEFLSGREGAVLTEFYDYTYKDRPGAKNPWLEILGKKDVFVFPERQEELGLFLRQHPDIRYAVIYAFGPRVPRYAAQYAQQNWKEVIAFEQWGNPRAAIVYEIPEQRAALLSLTFDDGLASQYEAARVLEQYGYRGTFYVAAGLLGSSHEGVPTMSTAQVQELHARGHEIGSHTYSHVNPRNVSGEVFEQELAKNKETLASLGVDATSFSYPYGEVAHEDTVSKYYRSGRNVIERINPYPVPEELRYKLYAIPLSRANLTVIDERLTRVKNEGGWLILVGHDVTNEMDLRPLYDVTNAELVQLLERIKSSGVKVVTVKEVIG